jgi:hypothetical protein
MTSPPIDYIKRTRAYYLALGYDNPYRWARFDDVPFTALSKPVAAMKLAIVTTAALFQPGKGDQGPGAEYNAAAKFYQVYEAPIDPPPVLGISHISYDRDHTTAEDSATFFPLAAMRDAVAGGRVGGLADVFFGLPTNRSQRVTAETDCPDLRKRMLTHGVDAAVLIPNCPVCHQSISLAARHLEAAGIMTVIMGCARDIVEEAGVPRFVFSDFPLGNAAGRPHDKPSQKATLNLALDLIEEAKTPRCTIVSPLVWPGDATWKESYSNPDHLTEDQIAARRASYDVAKQVAKAGRED